MPYVETPLKLEDIPVGESRCTRMEDVDVGIFRRPEGLFALDNICPHRGAPMHDGAVREGVVTCPWHQWQFRLADGICLNIPGPRLETFAVEVRDGVIWINLEKEEKPL